MTIVETVVVENIAGTGHPRYVPKVGHIIRDRAGDILRMKMVTDATVPAYLRQK